MQQKARKVSVHDPLWIINLNQFRGLEFLSEVTLLVPFDIVNKGKEETEFA
jgi:hypothetical protein